MDKKYQKTLVACFIGYIVQAVVNNFAPLLFLTFQKSYGISLSRITLLVTFNFAVQLTVDLVSVFVLDRIGYRAGMVAAHGFAALGLVLLAVLPDLLPSPFAGILAASGIYAVGGGILEVLVSPVVEACPTENKEKAMSMLHSFYCWGQVGVVLLSTLFFALCGIEHWRFLALLWALVPLFNLILFLKVPIATLLGEGEKGMRFGGLWKEKIFFLLFIMMLCAGASELAVSQWASALMERGFGLPKALGDLAGPMAFAILMGSARAFYGKMGDRISPDGFMTASCILCVLSYLGVALFSSPVLGLICCGLCGLSVGILWPGTFSRAAVALPRGGTAMFALLALGGDLGCSLGPTAVGFVSDLLGDDLKRGILIGALFPAVLLLGIYRLKKALK